MNQFATNYCSPAETRSRSQSQPPHSLWLSGGLEVADLWAIRGNLRRPTDMTLELLFRQARREKHTSSTVDRVPFHGCIGVASGENKR